MIYHFDITFKDHTTIYGFVNAENYYDATKALLDKYEKNDSYEEQQIADLRISIFELFNSKDSTTEKIFQYNIIGLKKRIKEVE